MNAVIVKYNELVEQQRGLTQSIDASVNALVAALETKLHLAAVQKDLQAELGIQYPELSPADVRAKVLDEVARRLGGRDTTPLRDWTIRLATQGGNLHD